MLPRSRENETKKIGLGKICGNMEHGSICAAEIPLEVEEVS